MLFLQGMYAWSINACNCQKLSVRSTFRQVQLLNLNPLLGANWSKALDILGHSYILLYIMGLGILGTTPAYSLPMGECDAGWDVEWLLCESNYKSSYEPSNELNYELSYKSSFRSANRASDLWIKLWIKLRRVAALHPTQFCICLWGDFRTSCKPNLLQSRATVFPNLFALRKTVIWAAFS